MNLCVSPTFSELHFPQPGDEKADQIFNAAVDLNFCDTYGDEDAGGDLPTSAWHLPDLLVPKAS